MDPLELARSNLLTAPVLAFAIGVALGSFRHGLKYPKPVASALSAALLLGIGWKGGVAIGTTPAGDLAAPAAVTLALGVATPLAVFAVLRRRFGTVDAAALAAHYGSVSVVTFTASIAFLTELGVGVEGFMPALVALLEIPAIAVALLLARRDAEHGHGLGAALREIVTGKSVVLLLGGVIAGIATAWLGLDTVPASFDQGFRVVLTVFLLDMGLLAASHLRDLRATGAVLATFAIAAPLVLGTVGAMAGALAGLSVGGTAVLATMTASASYIAAPAAVQIALPAANPSYYLTSALGITFPFNLTVGIPIYYAIARWMH